MLANEFAIVTVRELMGWVRNVVLMNVYLDLENPGGSEFRVRGHMGQVREMGSQFTSNPGKRWTDPVTARRVPSKWRGINKGSKGNSMYRQSMSSRVYYRMLVVIE
jgi:hypothetical protein